MEKGNATDREKALRVYTVSLEGMQFIAHHGCRPEEKVKGNLFTLDFEGDVVSCAGESDCLGDTVSYGDIYRVASAQMAEPAQLLESVADRIIRAMADEFPALTRIQITLRKQNPPVGGPCKWAGITLRWKREDLSA